MIPIRQMFYILIAIVFRQQLFLLFSEGPARSFHEVYFLPFANIIADSFLARKVLACSYLTILFVAFIKDTFTVRFLLSVALYLVASCGMMISNEGIMHSHWDFCLIAILGVMLTQTEDWIYYSRIVIVLKYFLAGFHKLINLLTMSDHGTIKTLTFMTVLTQNKSSALLSLLIENSALGYFIFIGVACFQMSLLIPVINNKRILLVGIAALLFHIINQVLFGILFFPLVLLVLLFFIATARVHIPPQTHLVRDLFANRFRNL